jgi:hypothetical protein
MGVRDLLLVKRLTGSLFTTPSVQASEYWPAISIDFASRPGHPSAQSFGPASS